MLLVLILLSISIFVLASFAILSMSTIKINIRRLKISNLDDNLLKVRLGVDHYINIGIYLFNKIKIFGINFKHGKIKHRGIFKMLKINNKNIKSVFKIRPSTKQIIKGVKLLAPKLEKINLEVLFDTEDVILTTTITTVVSNIMAFIFNKTIDNFKKENHIYKVTPLYINKNIVRINLNCIICIKMVHIINMYIKVKEHSFAKAYIYEKRQVNKSYGTSNTRNDGNSNGKHKGHDRCKYNYR